MSLEITTLAPEECIAWARQQPSYQEGQGPRVALDLCFWWPGGQKPDEDLAFELARIGGLHKHVVTDFQTASKLPNIVLRCQDAGIPVLLETNTLGLGGAYVEIERQNSLWMHEVNNPQAYMTDVGLNQRYRSRSLYCPCRSESRSVAVAAAVCADQLIKYGLDPSNVYAIMSHCEIAHYQTGNYWYVRPELYTDCEMCGSTEAFNLSLGALHARSMAALADGLGVPNVPRFWWAGHWVGETPDKRRWSPWLRDTWELRQDYACFGHYANDVMGFDSLCSMNRAILPEPCRLAVWLDPKPANSFMHLNAKARALTAADVILIYHTVSWESRLRESGWSSDSQKMWSRQMWNIKAIIEGARAKTA